MTSNFWQSVWTSVKIKSKNHFYFTDFFAKIYSLLTHVCSTPPLRSHYALSMRSLLFRYQIWRQIIFKREEESMASSLLNTIFRQNWYQCKSDYMDKAINSIFIWLVKSSFPTKTLKKWNWNLRIWIEYDLGSVLINCFFYLNWTNFGSFRS